MQVTSIIANRDVSGPARIITDNPATADSLDFGRDSATPWYYPYDEHFAAFMQAALPALYARGLQKLRALVRLATSRRFLERVRKTTVLAHPHKLL
ncbi:MAG: hypothetical protein V1750_01085 [Acidobacteriota bacterium]